jgi:methyl-accepting chemotaxis protein
VHALVADIALATQEQSCGLQQVNSAVTQMDLVVQQNAALVEEAAAATEAMKEEAAMLLARVARFRLQESVEAAPAQPRAAAGPLLDLPALEQAALAR